MQTLKKCICSFDCLAFCCHFLVLLPANPEHANIALPTINAKQLEGNFKLLFYHLFLADGLEVV